MPLIYLAGAIDRAKEDPTEWVEAIKEALLHAWTDLDAEGPLVIYSPFMAFQGSAGIFDKEHALRLLRINMLAVEKADLLLVHYQPGVETWGTPMEVLRADECDVPIMVWLTPKARAEHVPPYLKALTDTVRRGYVATAKGVIDILHERSIDVQEES